ncbi:MAG TPA: ABC transporter substrate binding protein [Elusimicrobiota bacterium]|nr:ABC transporter substrate binding protein [Elusimicrobiota bacterium]
MTRQAKPFLLAAALALACAGMARAAAVVAVLSSDSEHYREAFEGFEAAWGSSVPFVLAGRALPPGRFDAIVAFGSRAALEESPRPEMLVTCLALDALPAGRGRLLRVELLPPPDLLAARLKQLLPRLKVLRVLWTSDFEEADVEALSAAAGKQGFAVLAERIEDPEDLPARVRAFADPADALWLMPDPALVNARNFEILHAYAAAARIPFLAPTEGLAEKGATATLAVPFRDVGRAAAAALKPVLLGRSAPGVVHPGGLVVTLNVAAARAIGMDVDAARGVDRRLP